jgi:hypothetical protein
MRFHSLSLAVAMGCLVAAPLAMAQSDNNSATKPSTEKSDKMAQKQHTAGVPEGLTADQGTAMKQHTAGVPAGLLPDQGNAYKGASKNQ